MEKGTCSSFGEPEGLASDSPVVELAWEGHWVLWSELLQTFTMQVTLTWVPWPPREGSVKHKNGTGWSAGMPGALQPGNPRLKSLLCLYELGQVT